jgi:hypothetical protein
MVQCTAHITTVPGGSPNELPYLTKLNVFTCNSYHFVDILTIFVGAPSYLIPRRKPRTSRNRTEAANALNLEGGLVSDLELHQKEG